MATFEKPEARAVAVFYSYSHADRKFLDRLQKHLKLLNRLGIVKDWHDREIEAGEEWRNAIDQNLAAADIILLLISADFTSSDYCWDKEVAKAMERHKTGAARVIPIIVRPVDWSAAPFGELQALPKDGKPVTTWSNRESAWANVAEGIRKVAETLHLAPPEAALPSILGRVS